MEWAAWEEKLREYDERTIADYMDEEREAEDLYDE